MLVVEGEVADKEGCRARGRAESLNERFAGEIAMHGGSRVPNNCLIKGSRDINDPFIFEVARFR